jgi:putative ABC transport system substrate-binding protein
MEWRFAGGDFGRLPDLARELVRANVDVIVTSPAIASRAAADATATIPVVFAYVSNPVASGLVQSLAKPGANVTGLAVQQSDISPKQVELLAQAAPRVSRIAVLANPTNEGSAVLRTSVHEAVEKAGLTVVPLPAASVDEIERAIGALKGRSDTALIGLPDPFFAAERQRIAHAAIEAGVPSMFGEPDYAHAGGLMSYGDPLAKFIGRTAYYVDRILKGANPAELPVEQPTQFHFAINLRTAKALGLDISPVLLVLASEVIE